MTQRQTATNIIVWPIICHDYRKFVSIKCLTSSPKLACPANHEWNSGCLGLFLNLCTRGQALVGL